MKQRFSSLDVKVIAHELSKSLVSLRVANIYDLSSRIFLFKFAKPGTKQQLLVDSGFRCHLTNFTRTAAAAPSGFVQRFRKYLKTRRVTSVSQVGTDRVVDIEFSEGQYRLFLEFFSGGNVVLTDKDLNILAILRVVSEGNENVDVKLGGQYPLKAKQNYDGLPEVTIERLKNVVEQSLQREEQAAGSENKKRKKRKSGDDLRKGLSFGFPEYPPQLLDHAFAVTNFDASHNLRQVGEDEALQSRLLLAINEADKVLRAILNDDHKGGYVIGSRKESQEDRGEGSHQEVLYDDYHPFKPQQFEGKPGVVILPFDSFNKTVDEYYSSIESQQLESRLTEREEHAKRKLDNTRAEHEKRLGALKQVQELHIRQAEAISANVHRVQEAINAVNGLIGQGMDWVDIAKLIENEQKRDNPVAKLVKLPLKLYENTVTLVLSEASVEEDDDSGYRSSSDDEASESGSDDQDGTSRTKSSPPLTVDIDLGLSPWANAGNYYDQKKTAAVKEQRTMEASTKALKSAESKINADLKKGLKQEKQALQPTRKQMWFEKFIFFISSDGYLVLGGKDAQQNELLYRRYLKKGDVYVHADLQGASSVIVKNMVSTPDAPIPPSTLSQAGTLSVCTSSAWDSKAVMAAWWVESDQVSKTAPTGEYLTTGGFMIRGKKNFLPPSQLLLGLGVMFQISEDSAKNHTRHKIQYSESISGEEQRALELANHLEQISTEENAEEHDEVAAEESDAQNDEESESDHETASNAGSVITDLNPLRSGNAAFMQPDEKSTANQEELDAGMSEHEEPTSQQDENTNPTSTSEKSNAGRHLSARERRLLRKGQGLDPTLTPPKTDSANASIPASENDDSAPPSPSLEAPPSITTAATPAPPDPQKPNQPQPNNLSRGKRAKAKKAAQKYAHQDDEDRALAMQLLGSATGQQQKKADLEAEKAAREEKAARDKERRRAQHERAARLERKRQEGGGGGGGGAEGDGKGEGEDEIDPEVLEQERKELASLDRLVGTPMPGDEILAAVPVCGPWGAMATRCKYKVKLQPGSVKKGKAVREVVGRWAELAKAGPKIVDEKAADRERVWPREVECIKAWRVEEVFGVLPVGKVRVVQGAGLGGGTGGSGGRHGRLQPANKSVKTSPQSHSEDDAAPRTHYKKTMQHVRSMGFEINSTQTTCVSVWRYL
ncbi:MAG: hypothetical protein Q9227_002063 [Pyrenula ochraceoflavens]